MKLRHQVRKGTDGSHQVFFRPAKGFQCLFKLAQMVLCFSKGLFLGADLRHQFQLPRYLQTDFLKLPKIVFGCGQFQSEILKLCGEGTFLLVQPSFFFFKGNLLLRETSDLGSPLMNQALLFDLPGFGVCESFCIRDL